MDDRDRTQLPDGIAGYANLVVVDSDARNRLSALLDEPVSRVNVLEALDLLRVMVEGEQKRGSKHWAAAKKGRQERQAGGSRKSRRTEKKDADELSEDEETEDDEEEEYLREGTAQAEQADGDGEEMPDEDSADEDEEAQAFWANQS